MLLYVLLLVLCMPTTLYNKIYIGVLVVYSTGRLHALQHSVHIFCSLCCYPWGTRGVLVTSLLTSPRPIARAGPPILLAHNLCSLPFKQH